MNDTKKRLEQGMALIGTGLEGEIVGHELRELETEILEDPGALAPMLAPMPLRKRKTSGEGRGIVPL